MMDSSAILIHLRSHRGDLQARGVRHIAIFGSVATGQATESRDLDVLVDLNPDMNLGIYDYVSLKQFIAGTTFGGNPNGGRRQGCSFLPEPNDSASFRPSERRICIC